VRRFVWGEEQAGALPVIPTNMNTVTLRYSGVKPDKTFKPFEKVKTMTQLQKKVTKLGRDKSRHEIDIAFDGGTVLATFVVSEQVGFRQSRFFSSEPSEVYVNGVLISNPNNYQEDPLLIKTVEIRGKYFSLQETLK
jgi:hypothetical protein